MDKRIFVIDKMFFLVIIKVYRRMENDCQYDRFWEGGALEGGG